MALEVGTDTYVTVEELEAYALKRGIAITATDKEPLLVKAMDYIEAKNYKGSKTLEEQPLQFPRDITDGIVPIEIKNAQIVAALLIDSGEDLQPTLGKTVVREKIDVIEVQYRDNSTETKSFTQLNSLLATFLSASSGGGGLKLIRV